MVRKRENRRREERKEIDNGSVRSRRNKNRKRDTNRINAKRLRENGIHRWISGHTEKDDKRAYTHRQATTPTNSNRRRQRPLTSSGAAEIFGASLYAGRATEILVPLSRFVVTEINRGVITRH